MSKLKDLRGQKFGRLTVLELDKNKSTSKTTQWKCKCDCGNILTVSSCHLISGHTKSCGCYRKDTINKSNRIEFDTSLGCLRVYFNNSNEYFLCDTEDRDIVEKYCWHNNNGYAVGGDRGNNKSIRAHRAIMSKYENIDNFVIDHINHNKLDNRKFNLRKCTNAENQRNMRPLLEISKRYIYYEEERNKYVLTIRYKGKRIKWRFDTLEEAMIFRDNFFKEHPDEFRYDPDLDYKNINQNKVIHPFVFIPK